MTTIHSLPAIQFRFATIEDLLPIVDLLKDDELGMYRENQSELPNYKKALEEIIASSFTDIILLEELQRVVGCLQLMVLPHISFEGTKRAQIESVRIQKKYQNQGLGTKLMEFAIQEAKKQGCGIVQLTSNMQRSQIMPFYTRLGFQPSHTGYKLYLV